MTFRVLALIATIGVLAGCGGGGSHAVPSSAASAAGASGSGAQGAQGTARFTLTIPNSGVLQAAAKGRKPQFVSASTLSAVVTANPGSINTGLDLSVGSPLCTTVSGGRACTLPVIAPIGSDQFSMVLCNTAPPCTGGATALSAASNFGPITVSEGQTTVTAPLILGGIPRFVDVAISGTLVAGTPATAPVVITAYDASNNIIVGAGNYADTTGANAPLTLAIGSQQLLLHDGAQAASSITVAGPTDAVTLQLQAPADVLGTYVTVKNSASVTLSAKSLTRFVALTGTLNSTLLGASIAFFPDDVYLAPSDNTLVSGVPNGLAFSFTTASGGGYLGYLNSATEGLLYCAVPGGWTLGIGAITSGIASAFNAADNIGSPPTGIVFYPLTQLTNAGPTCAGGTPYTSNTPGFAKSFAFDPTTNKLFEGDSDGTLGSNTFTPPSTLSGNATVGSFGGGSQPHDLIALTGTTYFLTGTSGNQLRGINPTISATAGTDHLSALRNGQDNRIYVLGTVNNQVWVYNGTPAMQAYTPANGFTIGLSSQPNNLAIGPDGSAYATDGAATIQAVTPAGTASTLVIPPPSGQVGFLHGIFDGRNGYLYAEYDDGLHAGREYFYRISY